MGKETAAVTVVAFRAESYSSDGKNLIISLRTKYSLAERKYIVPLECLKDLLVDLQRLQASKLEHPAESLDQDAGAHQDTNSNEVASKVAARGERVSAHRLAGSHWLGTQETDRLI